MTIYTSTCVFIRELEGFGPEIATMALSVQHPELQCLCLCREASEVLVRLPVGRLVFCNVPGQFLPEQ
jgi:hypothetical protein